MVILYFRSGRSDDAIRRSTTLAMTPSSFGIGVGAAIGREDALVLALGRRVVRLLAAARAAMTVCDGGVSCAQPASRNDSTAARAAAPRADAPSSSSWDRHAAAIRDFCLALRQLDLLGIRRLHPGTSTFLDPSTYADLAPGERLQV